MLVGLKAENLIMGSTRGWQERFLGHRVELWRCRGIDAGAGPRWGAGVE
jgi:hypothetical protein